MRARDFESNKNSTVVKVEYYGNVHFEPYKHIITACVD
jgi:hypothetical protein